MRAGFPMRKGWLSPSLPPLLEIALIATPPAVTSEVALALVDQGDRAGAHGDPGALGLAAEIEIIEMKVELLVEPQRLGMQGLALHGKHDPVEQADGLAARAVCIDALGRE